MSELPFYIDRIVTESGSTTDELLLALVKTMEVHAAHQERIANALEEIAGTDARMGWLQRISEKMEGL